MLPSSSAVKHQLQWHLALLLLPFMLGIYVADYRNLTDNRVTFVVFLSIIGVLGVFFRPTKQISLVLLFFVLGFWCMLFAQQEQRGFQKITFQEKVPGIFKIEQSESKNGLQKMHGTFTTKHKGSKIQLPLLLYLKSDKQIQKNQFQLLFCQPERISNEKYPGAFDQERYFAQQGLFHRCFVNDSDLSATKIKTSLQAQDFFFGVRQNLLAIFSAKLSPRAAAIANALIIGDRSGIDQHLRAYFLATGAMHILAVSGMHIGLLIVALLQFLTLFSKWVSRKQALLLVVVLVWYYAILTGLSASVLRSVFMYSVLLLGQFSGRQLSNLSGLFFSAFCLLLYDATYLFDLGFQLSYMAMLGIYLYYDKIKPFFVFRYSWLQQLWDGTALGLAATLTTLPLSLYHFHMYPNYAQLANICLMSLSSFILILGMFFPFLQQLPLLDQISTFTLEWAINGMLAIMSYFSELPGAISQGFVLPFTWVIFAWLLGYFWFYSSSLLSRKQMKPLIFVALIWMNSSKLTALHTHAIYFLKKDKMVLVMKGNKGQVFGFKSAEKNAFLCSALSNYFNCQINYKPLKKGKYNIHLQHTVLKIDNSKKFKLAIRAKMQTQKIQVF
ncbi:MAG: ComEC/Rec2 family competence protein [Flavobacteriales bacterium]